MIEISFHLSILGSFNSLIKSSPIRYDLGLLTRGISRTNVMYGSKDIQVSNVVFVHGSIDPWHAMGVTKDLR